MLTLDRNSVSLSDIEKIVCFEEKILVDEAVFQDVKSCYHFLETYSKDKIIYGITTGFGPMAPYRIEREDRINLQYNLIRSHCSGIGAPIKPIYCRAALLLRLIGFLKAKSGVHESMIHTIVDMLNKNVAPVIYEHGGVGASGDLVQLAHVALSLIGEGKVWYKEEIRDTKEVFAELNIKPIEVHFREGLAIMNGTSVMTAIACVNLIEAQKLLQWSIRCSSIITELVESYDDYISEPLNNAKMHVGQKKIAQSIRECIEGSQFIRSRNEHLYKKITSQKVDDKVQEYYSIRCVPQIVGPIYDTFIAACKVVEDEVNSVSDNPIVDYQLGEVYHGGNFHGDYISLEMDKLKIAITKLSMLAERQLNYLMNAKLNEKFPPFLNRGVLGLNFGLQGIQFTATSTTAENQTLSNPMYVHSIPNNNDNQDIVSMGTNSALICAKVINNTQQVLAIHLMAVVQACSFIEEKDKFSPLCNNILESISNYYTVIEKDQVPHEQIERVVSFISKNQIKQPQSILAV